jgi:N-acetylneuraminate lyase
MHPPKTQGLIAAPFTPIDLRGSVDVAPIAAYADWLRRSGVAGAFVCGTTGETASLSCDERREVARAWTDAASPGFRVIVHVGHTCLDSARGLAAHAEAVGAHAISCLAPYFFRPRTVAELVDWCAWIADAAPRLPFYYYHMPSMTGVSFPMAEFMPLAAERIPSFAGIKYTYEDLADFERCLRFGDGAYDVLFGRDELLLSALNRGARGAVGSTYNFAAPLYLRLIAAFERGDHAAASTLQAQAVAMIAACVEGGGHPIASFKSLMPALGVSCGPARSPLVNPTAEQSDALRRRLGEMGCWFARDGGDRDANPST